MYNLNEHQLKQIQCAILNFYQTSGENRYRPEISTKNAISIFDRIVGQNAIDSLEKTNIIAYLQRNLLHSRKLITVKDMYRTV